MCKFIYIYTYICIHKHIYPYCADVVKNSQYAWIVILLLYEVREKKLGKFKRKIILIHVYNIQYTW